MKKLIIYCSLFTLIGCTQQISLTQDPSIKRYQLENGLNVILMPNQNDNVELRLVVHSGSLQETEQQQGLAHFVEHMAFKGTTNFPSTSSRNQLKQYGIAFGTDINAVTSFNSTTYKLSLPANSQSTQIGLNIMADWAYNILFDPIDFNNERNVIIEEWRLRQGVSYRINDQLDQLRYQGSLYAKRSPIGSLSLVKNTPMEEAKAYYEKWYQPQRMSLIVVGNFNQQLVRQTIEKVFGQKPKGTTPIDIVTLRQFSSQKEPIIKTIFDKEQGQRLIQIMLQRDTLAPLNTDLGMANDIEDQIWLAILNNRLQLLVEKQKLQLAQAKEQSVLLDEKRLQYLLFAIPNQNNYQETVQLLFDELQRMSLFPVSKDEYNQAIKQMLTKLSQQAANEANYRNNQLADRLVTAVEYQMPMISKKQQLAITQSIINKLTPEKLQHTIANHLKQSQLRLAIIGPDSDKKLITENAFISLWDQVRNKSKNQIGEFLYSKQNTPLQIPLPKPGSIVRINQIKEIDSEEWYLSNGMRVIINSNNKLTDNIQINLRISGGQSLDNNSQLGATAWAQQLAELSGYDKYTTRDLQQYGVLKPYAELLNHGFQGSTTSDQLESFFSILYLKLTSPKFDQQKLTLAQQNSALSLNKLPVERRFLDFIHKNSFNNSQRLMVDPNGTWRQFTAKQLQSIYQRLYSSPNSMVLTISGNVNKEQIKELTTKWLAGITGTSTTLHWNDNHIIPIHKSMQLNYPYGTSDKAMVSLLYTSEANWTQNNQLALNLLDKVVNTRLLSSVREKNSGVYTIIFSEQLIRRPEPYYLARLNFTTDPHRVNEIKSLVNQVMDDIRLHGITEQELIIAKKAWTTEYKEQQKSAQYWASAISQIATDDHNFAQLNQQLKQVENLSIEQINELAQKLIGQNPKMFTLLPK